MALKLAKAEQENYVQQYRDSGMTQREFAKKIGITFYALQWCLKLSRRKQNRTQPKGFIEVKAAAGRSASADSMRIEVGPAKIVFTKLPDAAWLAAFAAEIRGKQ